MEVVERGYTQLNIDSSSIDFNLDFETFLPIADVLFEMSRNFIGWQPHIVSIRKEDGSPVSNADTNAQSFITNWLHMVAPGIPVRGEEGNSNNISVDLSTETYWVIDPIDGTRYYEAMKDEWCVSIALVVEGEPRAAIVLQPGRGEAFVGIQGKGIQICTRDESWRELERKHPVNPMLVVPTSRSVLCDAEHPEYATQAVRLTAIFQNTFSVPSVLAVLEIVRGHAWGWASIFEPWYWDIAATFVLIREIGGVGLCSDGSPIPWGQDKLPPVVFAASRERAAAIGWVLNK